MKRILLIAVAVAVAAGCSSISSIRDRGASDNPYLKDPFYAKYLNTGSDLDTQIRSTLGALRQDPASPDLHNTLGSLLVDKGFPKDAEREFDRAIHANRKFYPAWYNLGLVRAARGDELGAHRAFVRTVALKPGHAAALFQLGLVEEHRHHIDRAVSLYAKAYGINPALLDVEVNPRILDSQLTDLALLKLYPMRHAKESMQFQGTPYVPVAAEAQASPPPEPQATQKPKATPTPPVTTPPAAAGAAQKGTQPPKPPE